MEGGNGQGLRTMKRAEIDTTAPFRSVKEAVMLFGERVLAGEVYASKFKEIQNNDASGNGLVTVTTELEETKENLQKAREESLVMATCLSTLQQELERTKLELRQLKERESEKQVIVESAEIKHVEFMKDSMSFDHLKPRTRNKGPVEFQKKRYVTFANPPSSARVMVPQGDDDPILERHPSLKKKKKKPLIPLIGGIFSKKK
ncbi:hypothetical protein RHSIM_Rhsim07G0246900 [Rhododendron simsii]|uniref:WEB family protein n=1 Tax=Rhododendron simsii TaxID=118357 RepID=A0A834GS32_RHOSS|nr:hypothetical protein RHSIM_Rhsim07G0246900 [Rhododendron simsii]